MLYCYLLTSNQCLATHNRLTDLLGLRLSSSRAAEHIGQQLVASMICLKPCPPPRSMSNEPVPGLLGMSFSVFSLYELFLDSKPSHCGLGTAIIGKT